MADWKEVRKEARSRDDRRQSSELHRNIRSRSSTPGSDSQPKHSAHMERERREPSSLISRESVGGQAVAEVGV